MDNGTINDSVIRSVIGSENNTEKSIVVEINGEIYKIKRISINKNYIKLIPKID